MSKLLPHNPAKLDTNPAPTKRLPNSKPSPTSRNRRTLQSRCIHHPRRRAGNPLQPRTQYLPLHHSSRRQPNPKSNLRLLHHLRTIAVPSRYNPPTYKDRLRDSLILHLDPLPLQRERQPSLALRTRLHARATDNPPIQPLRLLRDKRRQTAPNLPRRAHQHNEIQIQAQETRLDAISPID